jgi:hypothetical protein
VIFWGILFFIKIFLARFFFQKAIELATENYQPNFHTQNKKAGWDSQV